MKIGEMRIEMDRDNAPTRGAAPTTMRADQPRSKTRDDHKTICNGMSVAPVQTMPSIKADVFQHSTAAGNTWWMTGVATA